MKKRFFAALLAWMMVAALLTSTALAADVSANYTMDFSVNGTSTWHNGVGKNYTIENDFDNAEGWAWYAIETTTPSGVTYAAKTLVLNNFRFTTSAQTALMLPAGATIIVSGTNAFTANNTDAANADYPSCGIRVLGALTVTGSGSLSATAGSITSMFSTSAGVYAAGSIDVTGAALTGTGKESRYENSLGVFSRGNIKVSGVGALNGTGGAAAGSWSIGVSAPDGDIAVESGSRLNGTGGNAGLSSYGIECRSLRVTGSGSCAVGSSRTASEESIALFMHDASGTIAGNILAPAGGVIGNWTNFQNLLIRTVLTANGQPAAAVTLGIEEAPADVPETGDGSMPLLWAGLITLAGAGLLALKKRRRA